MLNLKCNPIRTVETGLFLQAVKFLTLPKADLWFITEYHFYPVIQSPLWLLFSPCLGAKWWFTFSLRKSHLLQLFFNSSLKHRLLFLSLAFFYFLLSPLIMNFLFSAIFCFLLLWHLHMLTCAFPFYSLLIWLVLPVNKYLMPHLVLNYFLLWVL